MEQGWEDKSFSIFPLCMEERREEDHSLLSNYTRACDGRQSLGEVLETSVMGRVFQEYYLSGFDSS